MIKLTDQINSIYSVVTRMGTTNSCHCTPHDFYTFSNNPAREKSELKAS